jgi:hypothetical protein
MRITYVLGFTFLNVLLHNMKKFTTQFTFLNFCFGGITEYYFFILIIVAILDVKKADTLDENLTGLAKLCSSEKELTNCMSRERELIKS